MNWLDALERECDLFCDKPDCDGCKHLDMMNDVYDYIVEKINECDWSDEE